MFLNHSQKLIKALLLAKVNGRKPNANCTAAFAEKGFHQATVWWTTHFHQFYIATLAKELFHDFVGLIDVVLNLALKNALLIFRQKTKS